MDQVSSASSLEMCPALADVALGSSSVAIGASKYDLEVKLKRINVRSTKRRAFAVRCRFRGATGEVVLDEIPPRPIPKFSSVADVVPD